MYAQGRVYVVSNPSEAKELPDIERLIVVAQTTRNNKIYHESSKDRKHEKERTERFHAFQISSFRD